MKERRETMAAKVKRAALYLRVSTGEQTTDNQRLALEAVAEQRGWPVVATYEDAGISGAKGRDKRPGLDKLLNDATRGRFDVVMGWALDRLGRSLADLIDTLRLLEGAHVDLFLHQQAIDTTTPAGRMFLHVTGAFAEFERDMIRSRVNAGLDRARQEIAKLAPGEKRRNGKKLIGRPKVSSKTEDAIRAHLMAGDGVLKTSKAVGAGVSTVLRVRKAMQQASGGIREWPTVRSHIGSLCGICATTAAVSARRI
jgi:DNA invertase Pin-like site-specific DNA recombinase